MSYFNPALSILASFPRITTFTFSKASFLSVSISWTISFKSSGNRANSWPSVIGPPGFFTPIPTIASDSRTSSGTVSIIALKSSSDILLSDPSISELSFSSIALPASLGIFFIKLDAESRRAASSSSDSSLGLLLAGVSSSSIFILPFPALF
ncbi:unnamed protein product, partial [Heterosigma akashiwo]